MRITKLPLLTLGFLLLFAITKAQSPQSIPYQAIARDSFNLPIANKAMKARISIRDGSSGGSVVYQETDTFTTSPLGLFTLAIGQGTVVSGTFSAINWGTNSKFLQVEVDPNGGTSYVDMGATQLLSVPFSLYSQKSGDISSTTIPSGQIPYGNGTGLGSSPNFFRDPTSGNIHFQAIRGDHYYKMNLGDSNELNLISTTLNLPAASFSYGDTDGSHVMHMGVGQFPALSQSQFGFILLGDQNGNQASTDYMTDEGYPVIYQTVGSSMFGSGRESSLIMRQNEMAMYWNDASSQHVHGIFMDSTSLKFFSSATDYVFTWPNVDGSNGQALVTNGSGDLSWADINMGTAAYTAKTSAYTLSNTDYTVNCTSGTFALTLPTAIGITGKLFVLNNSGTGTITLNTTSSQTIDGSASGTLTLAQYKNYTVQSDGSNWIVLSAK